MNEFISILDEKLHVSLYMVVMYKREKLGVGVLKTNIVANSGFRKIQLSSFSPSIYYECMSDSILWELFKLVLIIFNINRKERERRKEGHKIGKGKRKMFKVLE